MQHYVLKDINKFRFNKWFSGSMVIHNNQPIICYHGTNVKFNVFRLSNNLGRHGDNNQITGIYFTDNKDGASFFSLKDEAPFLLSVYLCIKKPYYTKDISDLHNRLGVSDNGLVRDKLISLGYDGIIMEKGFYANGGPYKLYLAFYPNQVKSVYNDGTFDINDENIYS